MRKLILPLIIVLVGCSFTGFSQGTDCNSANYLELDHTQAVLKLTCGNFPVSTVANQSTVGPCTAANNGRATWFVFIAPPTCPMLSIDGPNGTRTEVSVYTDCLLPPVAGAGICLANGSGAWSPPAGVLNPGDLYYLRIWTQATTGNIGICDVQTVAQEVALNGECTNVNLKPTNPVNIGGSISSAATCPAGVGAAGMTVTWVKFHTTEANNCVTMNVNGVAGTEVALYGNGSDCNNGIRLKSSVCYTDGIGVWSAGPTFPANLYTPNKDYYLRVYTKIAPGSGGIMGLCGTERAQAINDLCSSAIGFNVTPPLPANNACAHYTGTSPVEGLLDTRANYICATTLQNTVWYKFKVSTGGTRASVSISGIDCDSYTNEATLLQMGLLTGNCGSLVPAITPALTGSFPINNSPGSPTSCLATSNNSTVTLYTSTAVTAGQVVYLAIDGYSGANCKFNLQSINNIIPIPIILKYFTASKLPASNLIRWVTSSEHLNNYFEVERSLDGVNFVSIGRVAGKGESNMDQVYDLEDKAPPALAYYRLRQVDIDEKFSYSDVVMLRRTGGMFFNASMQNPVSNSGRITISTEDAGMVALRVVDAAGRQLMGEDVACTRGNNIVMKDFSRLAAGSYYLVLTQDSKRIVKAFVKQ